MKKPILLSFVYFFNTLAAYAGGNETVLFQKIEIDIETEMFQIIETVQIGEICIVTMRTVQSKGRENRDENTQEPLLLSSDGQKILTVDEAINMCE